MNEQERIRLEKERAKPGDYLKNVEMAVEGNYNMIDGAINNLAPRGDDLTDGQTYEELRNLAPESLPEAKREKRASVMELLKSHAKADRAFPKRVGKGNLEHDI